MNTQERDRGRAYADAFYEAAWERWLTTLEAVAGKVVEDRDLLGRLEARDAEFGPRQAALNALLPVDIDAPMRNLLYSLVQRGDIGLLPEITAALRGRMLRGAVEAVRVEVVSAVPLTDAECKALEDKLRAQYRESLEFRYRVDAAILGGMIVRVGDKLIDGSLASKLAAMKQALGVASD